MADPPSVPEPRKTIEAAFSFGAADASFRPVETAWVDWLDGWLAYQENFGTGPDDRIRAAHLMTFYAHHLACVAGHLFLEQGLVPDLSPEDLFVRFEPFAPADGRPEAARRFHFRLPRPAMHGSEDDLHEELLKSLAPAVAALNQRSGLSAGSLWRLASDGVFGACLDIGCASGARERGMAAGLAIVEKEGSPFRSSSPRIERLTGADGRERVYRIRSGCCLAYRAGEGRYCDVCVLLSAEERRRRLSAIAG